MSLGRRNLQPQFIRLVTILFVIALAIRLSSTDAVASNHAAPLQVAVDTGAAEYLDAVRIRETFGFPADSATVLRALTDPKAYPSEKWGTPLSDAEVTEVDRQVDLQTDTAPTVAWASEELLGYAGVWIDHVNGGRHMFMVAGDVGGATEALLAQGLKPETFDVQPAEHSYDDLLAIQKSIESQRSELIAAGVPLVTTGIEPRSNTVVVGLSVVDQTTTQRLNGQFGSGVSFKPRQQPQKDSCPTNNCVPTKGGIKVESDLLGNPCTTAFFVKVTTGNVHRAILTAGHCFRAGGTSGAGIDWNHPVTGPDYAIGFAEGNTWFNGANADVGVINLYTVPADRNDVYEGTGFGIQSITHITTESELSQDFFLCRMGEHSGKTCGQIDLLNETMPSPIEGLASKMIDHQVVVDFDSLSGDSGGPYYSATNGSWAVGIHTHSGTTSEQVGWFSSLGWAQRAYENTTGDTYVYCVTDTC